MSKHHATCRIVASSLLLNVTGIPIEPLLFNIHNDIGIGDYFEANRRSIITSYERLEQRRVNGPARLRRRVS